jgi:hypothetical protein
MQGGTCRLSSRAVCQASQNAMHAAQAREGATVSANSTHLVIACAPLHNITSVIGVLQRMAGVGVWRRWWWACRLTHNRTIYRVMRVTGLCVLMVICGCCAAGGGVGRGLILQLSQAKGAKGVQPRFCRRTNKIMEMKFVKRCGCWGPPFTWMVLSPSA